MSLTLITYDKLRQYLADGEIEAFDNAGADESLPLPDRVSGLIRKACNRVALYVNSSDSSGYMNLNQDAVPEELEDATLAIIRHMMLADLPDMGDMEGSPRSKAYDAAKYELRDVAKGILKLSPFENIGGSESESHKRVYSTSEKYLNWNIL